MAPEELHFSPVEEDRGWYFVEYSPPQAANWFATLGVVVYGAATRDAVAAAMESELNAWLKRYPVPLMVSAFDDAGALFELEDARPCNHLIGYVDGETGKPRQFWRLLGNEEAPGAIPDNEALLEMYEGIPYTTAAQTEREFKTFARNVRTGWWLVFIWVVAGPAAWALLQWAGPGWLGVLVLVYSLWKALVTALKLLGKWKPSSRELQEQEKQDRMEHYFYHCERNPEGFERLKIENFERDAREQIRDEASALKEEGGSARSHDDSRAD